MVGSEQEHGDSDHDSSSVDYESLVGDFFLEKCAAGAGNDVDEIFEGNDDTGVLGCLMVLVEHELGEGRVEEKAEGVGEDDHAEWHEDLEVFDGVEDGGESRVSFLFLFLFVVFVFNFDVLDEVILAVFNTGVIIRVATLEVS